VPSTDPLLADHIRKIRSNGLLFAIYEDIYARLLDEIPMASFPRVLEIGSGGGFLKQIAPHVLTSDCIEGPGIERVVDASVSKTLSTRALSTQSRA
jgi:hypothetical protein